MLDTQKALVRIFSEGEHHPPLIFRDFRPMICIAFTDRHVGLFVALGGSLYKGVRREQGKTAERTPAQNHHS
jgi:hypothetical protein